MSANRGSQQDGQTPAATTASAGVRVAPRSPEHRVTRFDPGELILNRFRVVRLIGRGGMGEVYEAEDLELGRIALKTIRPDFSISPHAFDRFRSEIQLARKVGGPQVCRIHELFLIPAVGSHPATALLTMEYLDGITLSEHLRRFGLLAHRQALSLARDICEGLRLVHQQGIVHRDLKCANIMLCPRGGTTRAILMDFGLAWRDARAESSHPQDSTAAINAEESGALVGTTAYMAPEQFEGKPVSAATDIYALGVVLYEMLTGLRPYEAATPVGAAIRRAQPPPPVSSLQRNLPRSWDRVIRRCLEYDPAHRYASASDVERALAAGPLHPQNVRLDHPRLLQAAALLTLIAAVWGGTRWWRARHYDRPTAQAASWYQSGLNALREGSYLKATRCLDNAVQQDNGFVMAHARLAEAWADLDFDGLAQSEMLAVIGAENRLAPLDRLYLDAIRLTLSRDFPGALARYRQIFSRLPGSEKAVGYIDLGMAEERAGHPRNALVDFRQAQRLTPQNPAPFLRAAIVETHQGEADAANSDFRSAEALYHDEMNPEGQAELDYERGYLANENEQNDAANAYLSHAVDEAHQINSPQLEIRALIQLSSVAYNTAHDADAVRLAQQAIALARDNQLDSWAADGFVRLATVQIIDGQSNEADKSLMEAFQLLHRTQQSRVEALANLMLASLRNQQHRFAEVSEPARKALAWYKANGYFAEAARASLLLARADRSLGNTEQALREANEVLSLATQTAKPDFLAQAEELEGFIYEGLEDYPSALDHFEKGLHYAANGQYQTHEALDCAYVSMLVGNFAETERDLRIVPPENISAKEIRVESLLNQTRYAQADKLVLSILGLPEIPAARRYDLTLDEVLAAAGRGEKRAVITRLHILIQSDPQTQPDSLASTELTTGTVYLLAGDARDALAALTKAEIFYHDHDLPASDLRCSLMAAKSAALTGDDKGAAYYSARSVDIIAKLRQTWSPSILQSYLARPDIRSLARKYAHLPS